MLRDCDWGRGGEGQSELALWSEVASGSTHSSVVMESLHSWHMRTGTSYPIGGKVEVEEEQVWQSARPHLRQWCYRQTERQTDSSTLL